MKNIIDSFITQFGIDSSDFKAKSKEINKTFDSLKDKSEKTAKSVKNSFSKNEQILPAENSTKRNFLSELFSGRSHKHLNQATKDVEKLHKSFSVLKNVFLGLMKGVSMFAPELLPLSAAAIGDYAITKFTTKIALQNTPFFFNAQRFNTPVSTLSALGQAISLTGGNANSVSSALGLISNSETQTRLFGNSALNPYLYALGVNFSKNGQARKPLDVLLDISKSLTNDVKAHRLTRQDAYNLLAMMGFSSDLANFLMQGSKTIIAQLRQEQLNPELTKKQVSEFLKVTNASAQLGIAFRTLENILAYQFSPFVIRSLNAMTFVLNKLNKFANNQIANSGNSGSYISNIYQGIASPYGGTLQRPNYTNFLNSKSLGYVIGKGESNNNYNSYNTGTFGNNGRIGHSGVNPNISKMSIQDILNWQLKTMHESSLNPGRLHAVGRYQFTYATLLNVARQNGISLNSLFNKKTQDKLFSDLIWQDAGNYISGKTNNATMAIKRIERDWTSAHANQQKIFDALLTAKMEYNKDKANMASSKNVTTHIGTINIHTQATDAAGIAKALRDHTDYLVPIQANSGLS